MKDVWPTMARIATKQAMLTGKAASDIISRNVVLQLWNILLDICFLVLCASALLRSFRSHHLPRPC